MKKFSLVFGVCVALVGCANQPNSYQSNNKIILDSSMSAVAGYAESVKVALLKESPEQVIEKAKAAVSKTLKDPLSAQFANVRLVKYLDGQLICGQINAKNSYGGYVGFVDFVGGVDTGKIRYNGPSENVNALVNTGLNAACFSAITPG